MDPEKRIAELEGQVRELTDMIHSMLAAQTDDVPVPRQHPDHHVLQDLRTRVEQAVRGPMEEGIEAHIGAVWLSRTALILLVGFLAFGTRALVLTDSLEAWQKLAVGYGLGALLLAAGVYLWRHHDVFAEGFLGAGLGLLYLSCYATLLPPSLRLADTGHVGSALLLGGMAAILVGAWRLRSQTLAVITALAAYLTAFWAVTGTAASLEYGLALCVLLALATFLLHGSRGWLMLSWVAVLMSHGCLQFAVPQAEPRDLASTYLLDSLPEYSPLFRGAFVAVYVFLTAAALADWRSLGRYHKSAATLSALNSLLFVRLAWPDAEDLLGAWSWTFWAVLAAAWLGCAVLAERPGKTRNHMFPLFLVKGVCATTMALAVYLPPEWWLAAIGVEGLVLAIAYKRSGVVFFKILGMGLVVVATLLGLFSMRASEVVSIAGHTLPRSMVAALAMGLSFSVTAAFYERFVRWMRPEERVRSGQWLLADSTLNWRGATMAIAHAAAAAFVLVGATIFQYGDDLRLPYLLAGEAFCFALLGLVLLTPQLEVGCLFLLLAAHLCYHVFLWLPVPGLEAQAYYVPMTAGMALFTYLGAYLWERYVRLFHAVGPEWEHHILVTGPYLAATAMLIILIWRGLEVIYVPTALAGLAAGLLVVGGLTRSPGIKGSAIVTVIAGASALALGLGRGNASLLADPRFTIQLLAFMAACLFGERLVALTQRWSSVPLRAEDHARSVLVAVPVALGAYAIVVWSPAQHAVFYLLGHGLAALVFGMVFEEKRYRWGALVIFASAMAWGAAQMVSLTPAYQALVFGLSALALLAASRIYSRMRPAKDTTGGEASPVRDTHDR